VAEHRIKVNCPKDPAVLYLVTISYFERHLKYNAFTDKLERNNNFPARGRNCYHTGKLTFNIFMEKAMTRVGKTLQRLTVSHAAPGGSRSDSSTLSVTALY
jgi:hypothetical protein